MQLLKWFGKATPPQNLQLIVLISNSQQYVDNFWGGLSFENRSINKSSEVHMRQLLAKLRQLSAGVRRLLKKLSFIFDLPTRLARAVELGAHAQVLTFFLWPPWRQPRGK